jgi:hypothetical protein
MGFSFVVFDKYRQAAGNRDLAVGESARSKLLGERDRFGTDLAVGLPAAQLAMARRDGARKMPASRFLNAPRTGAYSVSTMAAICAGFSPRQ